jgi:hypothetical protein
LSGRRQIPRELRTGSARAAVDLSVQGEHRLRRDAKMPVNEFRGLPACFAKALHFRSNAKSSKQLGPLWAAAVRVILVEQHEWLNGNANFILGPRRAQLLSPHGLSGSIGLSISPMAWRQPILELRPPELMTLHLNVRKTNDVRKLRQRRRAVGFNSGT